MKGRVFRTVCLALCVLCIVGDAAFGIYTRMSQTDYGNSPNSMASLPYLVLPVSQEVWRSDIEGQDLPELVERTKQADVIVRASLVGEKEFGYQAIVSSLRVSEVYRGDVRAGDTVTLIEPYGLHALSDAEVAALQDGSQSQYRQLLELSDAASADEVRLLQPTGEPYASGGALPLASSREYVLFLNDADARLVRGDDVAAFDYVPTPFACLPVQDAVEAWQEGSYVAGGDLERLTLAVSDEATRDTYMQAASELRAYAEAQLS